MGSSHVARPGRSRGQLAILLLLLLLAVGLVRHRRAPLTPGTAMPAPAQPRVSLARLPLAFEANEGQAEAPARFVARGPGYTLLLAPTEATVALRARDRQTAVRLSLVGANPRARAAGRAKLPGVSNYFLGNDPRRWRTNVPQYGQAGFRDVYPGVDLVYYGNQEGRLEHDFVLAPQANPRQIAFDVGGARSLRTDGGELVVGAQGGGELRLDAPVAYQEVDGARRGVPARYDLRGTRVAFAVGEYDRTRTLVIDPVLSYSTFLGGNGDDVTYAIAVDSSGCAYVTGRTASADLPTTGAYQGSNGGGAGDIFVTKLSAAGNAFVYSTYLGGNGDEYGHGIAVDSGGCAYVAGRTTSTNYPVQAAVQATNGGGWDACLTKLNAAGNGLSYSTYLGGTGDDKAMAIALDGNQACLAGFTVSTDFPTANALQATYGGGYYDAFVAKFSSAGSALVYSTYLGGSDWDMGQAIAVDSSGNAYLAGQTKSSDWPTVSPVQATCRGNYDACVAKLKPDGSALLYSTYLGGSDTEDNVRVAVDAGGNAYVAGFTYSTDYPTTGGAYQTGRNGTLDGFVTKLNAAGSALSFSTYFGGNVNDQINALAVDGSGNVTVGGLTGSTVFPTVNAIQAGTGSPSAWEGFVAQLNATGTGLNFSSYFGGNGADSVYALALDSAGRIYLTGPTNSTNFPLVNPAQSVHGTFNDAFIAKLDYSSLSTYTVTNTANSGAGSLRDAIFYCNSHAGADTIAFNIAGGGVKTISPTAALPTITDPVTIDGYTQPGAVANTATTGTNAQLKIWLDGAAAPSAKGLTITGQNCTVRGLVVSRWSGGAVCIRGTGTSGRGTTVAGCFIGTDVAGTTAMGGGGIVIDNNASTSYTGPTNCTIGGATPAARNLISGGGGVMLDNAGSNNVIAGNLIGLNAAGDAALPNTGHGVYLRGASNTTVGGTLAPGDAPGTPPGNVISGNGSSTTYDGVLVTPGVPAIYGNDCTGNVIKGNVIGLNAAGTAAIPNGGCGVRSMELPLLVGGATAAERNVIAGNTLDGVFCDNSVHMFSGAIPIVLTVTGNYIGTSRDGTAAVPNGGHGIHLIKCMGLIGGVLGGTDVPGMAPGNVISGNSGAASDGIHIEGQDQYQDTDLDYIRGNLIGLNAAGTGALANGRYGIWCGLSSLGVAIGGSSATWRNVISGNTSAGICVDATGDSSPYTNIDSIRGNYLGTNRAGTAAVPNGVGVRLAGAVHETIGGTSAGTGNVISGNSSHGVQVLSGATSTGVQGNLIGVGADGTTAVSNGGDGVHVEASSAAVGGSTAGAPNTIANNVGAAVSIATGLTGNKVWGNSLYANGSGILLNGTANASIAAPALQLVTVSSGQPTITWTWSGAQLGPYRVEFFSNPAGSPAQGRTYLGSVAPSSIVGSQATALTATVNATDQITATITDRNNNTSALSAPLKIADHLGVTQQPANGQVGVNLPAVKVAVYDAIGTVITSGAPTLDLALLYNPTGATLTGTLSRAAVNGVATFDDLQVNKIGTGYTFRVSRSPLASADTGSFNVAVGPVSASHSTATVPGGTAGAATAVTVQARDAGDNPRTTGGSTVAATVSGANAGKTVTVVDNANGTYSLSYTPTAAGTDTIAITLGGSAISGSPFSSAVVAGAVNAGHTTAVVPTTGAVDAVTTITVTARDAYNNARSSGGDTVAGSVTGANAGKPVTTVDHGNGTYTLSYTPTSIGSDSIALTLGGSAISGSPFTSQVAAGPADAAHSTAAVPATGTAGTASSGLLTARDVHGNARTTGGDTVAATVSGANAGKVVAVTDHADGTYTLTYTPTAAGTDTIAVTLGGVAISGSPFSSVVAPGAASASHTTASVPAGTAGSVTSATVTVRDACDNVRTAGGDAVAGALTGPNAGTTVIVTDHPNGTYTIAWTPTVTGTDTLAVTLGGSAISGSPFSSAVSAGPANAAHSTAVVPATGTAGSLTIITVSARDANGNARTTGGDTVAATVTGANAGKVVTVTDNHDGTYSLSYTPTAAGGDSVAITLDGSAIGGSPFGSTVAAGAMSAAQSTFTASKGTAEATGTDTVTFSVTVRDAEGNPIAGVPAGQLTVAAAPTTGVSLTQPAAATNTSGQTTATAASTVASATPVVFSVTVGGTAITQTASVTFVPGPADATHTTATVPASGAAGAPVSISVQTRDATGNQRTAGGDTVAGTVTGANAGKPVTVTDHGDGTYTLSYTPTATGTDAIAITLGGGAINGSPYSTAVGPGPASGAQSTASAPATATAGGYLTIWVQARDAYGNKVTTGGEPVAGTVTGANAGQAVAGQDHGNGIYSLSYVPQVVGTDTIAVTLGGTAVSGSPFAVPVGPGSLRASTSTLAADKGSALATGADVVTLTLTAKDAYGNPIAGLAASRFQVSASRPAGVTITQPTAATDASGRTTATATSVTVASSGVVFAASFDHVNLALSGPVTFGVGPTDAAHTTAGVPTDGGAGVPVSMAVQARDAGGNARTTGGDTVVGNVTGANAGKPVTVTDHGDGTYALTYTPTAAGTDSVAVTLGGVTISGSPFSRTVYSASTVMASTSSLAADKATAQATGTDVVTLTITARDAYGNPIAGLVANRFLVNAASSGVSITQPTTATDAAGRTTATATGVVASGTAVRFAAWLDRVNIAVSGPVTFVPGPADPAHTAATVPATGTAGSVTTATVTAFDAHHNARTAGGDTVAATITGANAGKPVTVGDNGDGTYTLSYTPTAVGTDSLAVRLGGTAISGSPYPSTVGPGPASGAQSTASAPATGVAGGYVTVWVQARDVFGNKVTTGGEPIAGTVSGANAGKPVAGQDYGEGTYSLTYAPTTAGTDTVAVTLGSTAVSGSPFTVPVGPGSLRASTSTLAADKSSALATGADVVTLTLTAKDAYGNPIAGLAADRFRISVSPPTGVTITQPAAATDASGQITATATSVASSSSGVVFAAAFDHVNLALSGPVTFGAGPADAAHTTASVPASGIAGLAVGSTVQTRDASGNPRTTGGDTVAASITGANAGKPVTTRDNGDGTYTLSYTPTVAGTDSVAITLGGAAISGSPFSRTTSSGPVMASTSTLTADKGTAQATGSDAVTLTITARDAYSNPIPGLAASRFAVTSTAPTGQTLTQPATVTDGAGRTTATVTSVVASSTAVQFVAWFDHVSIAASGPVTFGAGPADPAHTTAGVPATGTAGSVTTLTVQAYDARGNARVTGGDTVAGVIAGANAGKSVTTRDNADGTYTLTYTPTVAGPDTVAITLAGTAISGSPFASTVSPGPASGAHSTPSAPASGVAGGYVTVWVQARDTYGNKRTAGGDPVAATVTGANAGKAVNQQDYGNGTYSLTYIPTVAGTDTVAVTLGGAAVAGSPFTLSVGPGSLAAATSTLSADRSSALANGSDAVTLTLTARDGYGNPIGGLAASRFLISASLANGVTIPQPTAATDASGRTTATASSVVASSGVVFVAWLDRVSIAQSGPVTFGSGPTDAAHSTASVPARATAGGYATLWVQARDAYGNKRTVGGDSVAGTVTGANASKPTTVRDNGDGTYSLTYAPTVAGTDTVAVTLGGTAISGSPFTLTIGPGSLMASTSTLTADKSSALASGTDVVTLTVTARDGFGNPIPGLAASRFLINAAPANGLTITQATAATDASGRTTATATSVVASSGVVFAAWFDQVNLAISDPVTFGAASADAARSSASLDPGTAGTSRSETGAAGAVGVPTVITVQCRDAHGNARTTGGDAVTVSIAGANSATPTVRDEGNGTYTASYLPTHAGTDRLSITVNGEPIAGSPLTSRVAPGAVDAQRSTLSADRATAAADGSQPVTLRLVLQDAHRNPIPGVQPSELRVTADPADGVSITAPAAASDANGAMTAAVVGTKAQTVTLSVTARGVTLAATGSVRFRAHLVLTLPAGKQFLGLPFTPDDPTPEGVLGTANACVKRWDPARNDYVQHQPGDAEPDGFMNFGPGRGLWLAPSAPLKLDLLGEPAPGGPVTLAAPKGWSNLANPFDRDLPWSLDQIGVLVNGVPQGVLSEARLWATVRPYLWLYTAAQDRSVPVFPPYTQPTVARYAGFWAYALVDGVQLVLNQPAASRARAQASGPRDWQLQLTAQQADGAPAVVLVGASGSLAQPLPVDAPPDASAARVRLEVLPAAGSRAAGELKPGTDSALTWELSVTVPQDGDVTLAWPSLLRSLPRGLMVSLQDLAAKTTLLLNTHGSYRFAATRGERRLRLVARFGHADRSEITALSVQGRRGRGMSVTLSLSGPGQVTLRVRGLAGRLVRELTTGADAAGALTVGWDGTDRNGRPVPAGTYQLEATAVSSDGALSRAVRTVSVP